MQVNDIWKNFNIHVCVLHNFDTSCVFLFFLWMTWLTVFSDTADNVQVELFTEEQWY